jgi:hypothetical protein
MLSRTGKTVMMTLRVVFASRRPQPLHRLGDVTMRTIMTFLACFFVFAAVAAGCSSSDASSDASSDDSSRLEEICKGLCTCEGGCSDNDLEDCQQGLERFDLAGCQAAFDVFYDCAVGYSCDCSAEAQSLENCLDKH